MTLDEIFESWAQDSHVNRAELGNESIEIPKLHHKYFRMMSNERLLLKKLETEHEILKANKQAWMEGTLTQEELKNLGWEVNLKRMIKAEIEQALKSDEDMVRSILKLAVQREKTELLKGILEMISNRSYQISAAINYERFKAGIG